MCNQDARTQWANAKKCKRSALAKKIAREKQAEKKKNFPIIKYQTCCLKKTD